MIHRFIKNHIVNLKQERNEFVLLKVSNTFDLEYSEAFYHDYEWLLSASCELSALLGDSDLLDYYLGFFDSAKFFKSERFYYNARSSFLKKEFLKAKEFVQKAITEDMFNKRALLLCYELYGVGFFTKERAIFCLNETR